MKVPERKRSEIEVAWSHDIVVVVEGGIANIVRKISGISVAILDLDDDVGDDPDDTVRISSEERLENFTGDIGDVFEFVTDDEYDKMFSEDDDT